jgi:hypothetical protein
MTALVLAPMSAKAIIITGIVAWSGIAAAVLTMPQEPLKAKFGERWESVAELAPLKKQDRLVQPADEPRPVITERVLVAPPEDVKTEPRPPIKPIGEHNICARHGMHKVTTRGGKSWRCRR